MVATEAQARVNFYLGVCLALVCAAMLILNLTRGDFILSGALGPVSYTHLTLPTNREV